MLFVLMVVEICVVIVKADPSPVTPKCGYESCTKHNPHLLNVHIVPHSHQDVGWVKTVREYYLRDVRHILSSVVENLRKDPEKRFIYVESYYFFKWWDHQSKLTKAIVKTLVEEGRLQFAGGAWSMNDEATTHYQSIIDQFTYGLRKLNETFGLCGVPRAVWQIDPFGHSREFAALAAAMGFDGLFLGRIHHRDMFNRMINKSLEMVWRGDDDLGESSDIFASVLYNLYLPPKGFYFDIFHYDTLNNDFNSRYYNIDVKIKAFVQAVLNQSMHYQTNNVLVTMGGDFVYQNATSWFKNLDLLIRYLRVELDRKDINVFYSTPQCYLKAVRDDKSRTYEVSPVVNPTLPTKNDDFFPYALKESEYWTGFFTSRPTLKYFERFANRHLQVVKQLQVLADLKPTNLITLNKLKSAMGIMQHHDAITGTEKQYVAHDYEKILSKAIDESLSIPQQAFNKFMNNTEPEHVLNFKLCQLNESSCGVTESSDSFIVTVYNPLAWSVNDAVRIPVEKGVFTVYSPSGKIKQSQIVPIPRAVRNIITRRSRATQEIVFIAHLKPLSFKNYYVHKSTNRTRRMPRSVESKFGPFALKQSLSVSKNTKTDIGLGKNKETIKYLTEVTKNNKNKLKKIINDPAKVMGGAMKSHSLVLNTYFGADRNKISNVAAKHTKTKTFKSLRLQKLSESDSNIIEVIYTSPDGRETKMNITFGYYSSQFDGAYVFSPLNDTAENININYTEPAKGDIVEEVTLQTYRNISSTLRIYEDLNFVEHDWVVGPIDVRQRRGKEYVVKYATNVENKGIFYTDSNGRQLVERIIKHKAVGGNYYPVTNQISIKGVNKTVSILTDRAEGATSLREGEIELMLHRRLIEDDGLGLEEPLNEMANGYGLVVRGRHRIVFGNNDKEHRVFEKKLVKQFDLQPQIFVADAKKLSFNNWLRLNNTFSFATELPLGVHVLSLEPLSLSQILLRLENYLQKSDDVNATIEIDMNSIFKTLSVKSFRETTLSASRWIEDLNHRTWKTKENNQTNYNHTKTSTSKSLKVILQAKQIRTFIVDYFYL